MVFNKSELTDQWLVTIYNQINFFDLTESALQSGRVGGAADEALQARSCCRWVLLHFQQFILYSYIKYTWHIVVLHMSVYCVCYKVFTPFVEVYHGDVTEARWLIHFVHTIYCHNSWEFMNMYIICSVEWTIWNEYRKKTLRLIESLSQQQKAANR